jgi:chromosomal replication initiation ATPase DnaA
MDIKKKTIAAPANSSQFQNTAAQSLPFEKPVEQPKTADSDSMEGVWSQLTAKIQDQNSQAGGFLSQARPAKLQGDVLVIHFSNSFALEMIKKKDDLVRSILKDILRRDVTVQYELAKAQDSKTQTPSSTPPSPGMRLNRQQQDEVLSDPAVQMIMRGLSARPVQIDRIEEEPAEQQGTEETSL